MSTYPEFNDRAGLARRLLVMAHQSARWQYLRILEEIDAGIEVTQPISAADLRRRLVEAYRMREAQAWAPLLRRLRMRAAA